MSGEESSKQSAVGDSNAQADRNGVANVINLNLGNYAPNAPSRNDDSSGAVSAVLPPMIRHLPPRNPDFMGRQEILTSLYDAFTTGKANAQAISGMGGIGKTQIALAYTYDHWN